LLENTVYSCNKPCFQLLKELAWLVVFR